MQDILIEFDGGTTCNIPRLGYGVGYGSYRLNEGPVTKWNEGHHMSCNAAEIRTLRAAVLAARVLYCGNGSRDGDTRLTIRGDSQIALKWAKGGGKLPKKGSPEFIEAIRLLHEALAGFGEVITEWWPRANSVRIFGH